MNNLQIRKIVRAQMAEAGFRNLDCGMVGDVAENIRHGGRDASTIADLMRLYARYSGPIIGTTYEVLARSIINAIATLEVTQ